MGLNELSYNNRIIDFISRDWQLSQVILVYDDIVDIMRNLVQRSFTLILAKRPQKCKKLIRVS